MRWPLTALAALLSGAAPDGAAVAPADGMPPALAALARSAQKAGAVPLAEAGVLRIDVVRRRLSALEALRGAARAVRSAEPSLRPQAHLVVGAAHEEFARELAVAPVPEAAREGPASEPWRQQLLSTFWSALRTAVAHLRACQDLAEATGGAVDAGRACAVRLSRIGAMASSRGAALDLGLAVRLGLVPAAYSGGPEPVNESPDRAGASDCEPRKPPRRSVARCYGEERRRSPATQDGASGDGRGFFHRLSGEEGRAAAVVARRRGELDGCVDDWAALHPGAGPASLTARLFLDALGAVESVALTPDPPVDPALYDCLAEGLSLWVFTGNGSSEIELPIRAAALEH